MLPTYSVLDAPRLLGLLMTVTHRKARSRMGLHTVFQRPALIGACHTRCAFAEASILYNACMMVEKRSAGKQVGSSNAGCCACGNGSARKEHISGQL